MCLIAKTLVTCNVHVTERLLSEVVERKFSLTFLNKNDNTRKSKSRAFRDSATRATTTQGYRQQSKYLTLGRCISTPGTRFVMADAAYDKVMAAREGNMLVADEAISASSRTVLTREEILIVKEVLRQVRSLHKSKKDLNRLIKKIVELVIQEREQRSASPPRGSPGKPIDLIHRPDENIVGEEFSDFASLCSYFAEAETASLYLRSDVEDTAIQPKRSRPQTVRTSAEQLSAADADGELVSAPSMYHADVSVMKKPTPEGPEAGKLDEINEEIDRARENESVSIAPITVCDSHDKQRTSEKASSGATEEKTAGVTLGGTVEEEMKALTQALFNEDKDYGITAMLRPEESYRSPQVLAALARVTAATEAFWKQTANFSNSTSVRGERDSETENSSRRHRVPTYERDEYGMITIFSEAFDEFVPKGGCSAADTEVISASARATSRKLLDSLTLPKMEKPTDEIGIYAMFHEIGDFIRTPSVSGRPKVATE
jgi:hypothetical protein